MSENFSALAVGSIYSGKLLCQFSDMHEAIEKLAGGAVWTHQIPRVCDELRPMIEREAPAIAAFDFSPITPETIQAEVARFKTECGETVHLPAPLLSAHEPNPLRDIPEGKKVIPVIVSAAAVALVLLASPADAVPTKIVPPSEGGQYGLNLQGNQLPWNFNGKLAHWNSGVAVGPFTQWAKQNPDGPGAKGRPPSLAEWFVCAENRGNGVTLNPRCGEKPRKAGGKPPVVPPVHPPVTPPVIPVDPKPPVIPVDPTPPMSVIPLPASLPLFLAALAGLGWVTRRRG